MAARLSPYGAMGVHLFFALSGFLITSRLNQEHDSAGRISLTNFYIRRAFRILPPLFAYLAVIGVLGFVAHLLPMDWPQLAASVFFYRNYWTVPVVGSWYTAHFWSLAVEEHFYLLWPGLLWLVGLRRARYLAPVFVLMIAIWRALDMHFGWVARLNPALRDSVERTDYRFDILLCGCVLALAWEEPWFRRTFQAIDGSLLVLATLAAVAGCLYWQPPGALSALAILMAILPAATAAQPGALIGRMLEWPVLVWIGRISYSLYIWQQLFFPVSVIPESLGALQHWPVNLIAALGCASLSYYIVERPAIALGRLLTALLE